MPAEEEVAPPLVGLHHLRIPVTGVETSRDWYVRVLGLTPLLDHEEEDRLTGVVLGHGCGLTIGLHLDPAGAAALRGYALVALAVSGVEELANWSLWLEQLDVPHTPVLMGTLGSRLEVADPDGIVVELLAGRILTVEEA